MAFFLPSLKKSGHLDQLQMTVCNVGSRKVAGKDDYGSQAWGIFAPNLTIYGFDADADACEAANADLEARQINWREKHIPAALARSVGEAPLYVTQDRRCTSLYPPNTAYLRRFIGISELTELDFTVDIETTTLDTVCQVEGINEIDFIQIDVQGANLQVLEGGTEIVGSSVLAIQIEVEFSHLYKDQPLFADVDVYLRQQGFTLFDLATPSCCVRSPLHSNEHPGQLLWADAIYFRDLIRQDLDSPLKTPAQILKLACIADILNFTDYSLELLEQLTLQYGKEPSYNFADDIFESLTQLTELSQQELEALPVVERLKQYTQT